MRLPSSTCTSCNAVRDGQYWGLSNYHGITGYFCSMCYDKVAHDSYGNPRQPTEYLMMLLKLGVKHGT